MNSTTPQPPQTQPSLWRVLWLGTLVIVALEAISIFVGAQFGGLITFFALLFGGFVICGASAKYLKKWAGVAGVIGFLVGTVISMGGTALPLSQSLTGQASKLTGPISVTRAPEYTVSLYEFTDAQVQTKLTGYHSYKGQTPPSRTGGRGYPFTAEFIVAPLVNADWTPADEVPAWVVCDDSWETNADFSDTDTCRREWTKSHQMGLAIDLAKSQYIKIAVDDALATHELRSHPNAPYILWSKDAAITARGASGLATMLIFLGHASYIIAVVKNRHSLN